MKGAIRRAVIGSAAAVMIGSPSAARAAPPGPVVWQPDWPRFQWWEAGATVGLTLGSLYAAKLDGPDHASWTGGILLDVPIRNGIRGDEHVRFAAKQYSDVGYRVATLFPYVVDAGIVALGVHQNPDVAFQMFLIDVEALTLTAVVTVVTERTVGRQRPFARACQGEDCASAESNRSFYSGHAAATFTSAGLTCAHHQNIPLYGGGPADAWACVWALSLATTTGFFRVVADNHYASDVVVGAAVGLASGYLLPSWLHYGLGHAKRDLPARSGRAATGRPFLMPIAQRYEGGAGIGIGGVF
jgi:membrane-associated phospholipid phosphatase